MCIFSTPHVGLSRQGDLTERSVFPEFGPVDPRTHGLHGTGFTTQFTPACIRGGQLKACALDAFPHFSRSYITWLAEARAIDCNAAVFLQSLVTLVRHMILLCSVIEL
jgi:hypothetical protein